MGAYLSSDSSSPQIRDRSNPVAILPIGATEQCGPYLPCNVDTLVADYCSRRYAEILDAYLAPLMPYNTSQEHGAFAGTLSLSAPLLMALATEISLQLARQGFIRQILLSPHGGSAWAAPFLRAINCEHRDLVVVSGQAGAERSRAKALAASGLVKRAEIHGGVMTVMTVAFLKPDRPLPPSFGCDIDPSLQEFVPYGVWDKITPDGAWGRFDAADAALDLRAMGRRYWETFTTAQAEEIRRHLERAAELKGV